MAERRMFAKTIVDSDAFLDMPLSTQALYFHLSMRADDDGFVNNPKKIARMLGSGDDEFKVLLAKKFLLGFESGVIVIKHWKIHNYIRKDRYTETNYKDEMSSLGVDENNSYTLNPQGFPVIAHSDVVIGIPTGIPMVATGKDRVGKDRVEIDNTLTPSVEGIDDEVIEAKVIAPSEEEAFLSLYNDTVKNLPKAQKLSEKRKKQIKARLKEEPDFAKWEVAFKKCDESTFACSGGWCNLDWFIQNDTNWLKAIEGKYDNKGIQSKKPDKNFWS